MVVSNIASSGDTVRSTLFDGVDVDVVVEEESGLAVDGRSFTVDGASLTVDRLAVGLRHG